MISPTCPGSPYRSGRGMAKRGNFGISGTLKRGSIWRGWASPSEWLLTPRRGSHLTGSILGAAVCTSSRKFASTSWPSSLPSLPMALQAPHVGLSLLSLSPPGRQPFPPHRSDSHSTLYPGLYVFFPPSKLNRHVFHLFRLRPLSNKPETHIWLSGLIDDLYLNRDFQCIESTTTNMCQAFHSELTGVLWDILNFGGKHRDICQTLQELLQTKLQYLVLTT